MTITAVRPVPVAVAERGDWLFVELETDIDLEGTGEASQSGDDRAGVTALHEIGAQLIGRGRDERGSVPLHANISRAATGRSAADSAALAEGAVAEGFHAIKLAPLDTLEYAYGEVPWRAELLDPPELIRDGEVMLGDRPGIGHRLAADVMSGHRR